MKAATAGDFAYLKWERRTDPPYYVNSTAISGDGGRIVAGTFYHVYAPQMDALPPQPALPNQYGTYCFDRDGRQLWADKFQGYEGVYAVAISADGKIAASGGWYSSSPFAGFVRAYEVDKGSEYTLNFQTPERVNALALSADGSTLVAAADKIYLFQLTNGIFPSTPAELTLQTSKTATTPNSAQSISVAADGSWILAGDLEGNVYFVTNDNGTFGTPFIWNSTSLSTVHSVAMNPAATWFAVGGSGSTVYVFSRDTMTQSSPSTYAGTYALDTGGRVGWVAITDDGSIVSAIGNKGTAGAVVAIKNDQGKLSKLWESPTNHNPNSTSMDSFGKYVSVADGYPDGKPGSFSLFDGSTGASIWSYPTDNMNWPMFISADASGIVAGSDDGNVFYFNPTA